MMPPDNIMAPMHAMLYEISLLWVSDCWNVNAAEMWIHLETYMDYTE